jgi:NAD+ dependent glucose-6-phosphate dehydrogenase
MTDSTRRRVLITGAAGRIGTSLRHSWQGQYALRLLDRKPIQDPGEAEALTLDIGNLEALLPAMEGVDAVVHLAGDPSPRASWESVHQANIVGTYNVFESARRAGVQKIVFATTNHVMGMYDRDRAWPIYHDQMIRPDSLYGVSKAFGEALGRYLADEYELSVICLRIGWFLPQPHNETALWMWLSPRDAAQVFARAIESPRRFGIYYAISNNSRRHWDITNTIEELGYRPQDDAEAYAAEVLGDPRS